MTMDELFHPGRSNSRSNSQMAKATRRHASMLQSISSTLVSLPSCKTIAGTAIPVKTTLRLVSSATLT
ncbi:hypothetical protein BD414DRAFT_481632 [Trametes punicea]|nr:hypothetical protein BD414DRAFT_481632 [Trametes punicea]